MTPVAGTADLQVGHDGAIATVTLARTAKANALDQPLLDALEAALDAIDRDPGCKVMLLASASPKAFCAGGDIAAWGALSPREMATRWIRDGHRIFDRLAGLRQPTIAVIEGIAYGGGLELAACCDLRVAGEGARFALPETTVATAPGWAGTLRVPRLIGPARTKRLAFTGDPVDAATALAWGLVDEVAPAGTALAAARALAARIARSSALSVQVTKQMIDAAVSGQSVVALDSLAAQVTLAGPDAAEARAAFREKRKPSFE
ncbi:MAG: enoyl-CoA hydratase/isomerase family protein [Betaproteobacteria bacterium]|nr:enoyl-CoA hydratase/isomerase family protein [Betaproteobacteria bacterium]